MSATSPLCWDLYCRVVDNLGDAGIAWRLAADLGARGDSVRLVIDDPAPLAFMAPAGAPNVTVEPWPGLGPAKADVLVELLGCDPPAARIAELGPRARAPVWINLEHLSAEPYVERCHGLPSPQPGGRVKWFFYPGFSGRTGGLLREPGLAAAQAGFQRQGWLADRGIELRPGERVVSLFCYANPALPALLGELAQRPTLLLLTPGPAQEQVGVAPAGLRLHRLPWLTQLDFDRLLWSSDLAFVRGEDSLVRALWAGTPFVWQAYRQDDGAHAAKVEALLALMAPGAGVAAVWRAWNGLAAAGAPLWPGLPALEPWQAAAQAWRAQREAQEDLVSALRAFVHSRQAPSVAPDC